MLHTIISLDDVFYEEKNYNSFIIERSSNPYDYIRAGWYLDNSALFEGVYNVSLNSNYRSNIPGNNLHTTHK